MKLKRHIEDKYEFILMNIPPVLIRGISEDD